MTLTAGPIAKMMELNRRQTLALAMTEATMTQDNQKTTADTKEKSPDLQDVEPGSDADATPVPEVGKTPQDPNKNLRARPQGRMSKTDGDGYKIA